MNRRFRLVNILIIALLVLVPMGSSPIQAADDVLVIGSVYIEKTYSSLLDTTKGVIEIEGSGLKGVMVRVRTTGGGGSKILGTDIGKLVNNDTGYVKFEMTGTEVSSIIFTDGITIGESVVSVDEAGLPTISNIQPNVVYTTEGTLNVYGSNLDSRDNDNKNKDDISFGNGTLNANIARDNTAITLTNIVGDLGMHDIIFTRKTSGTINVTERKLYQDQFRVIQRMDIDSSLLEMYPNKGVPKETTVYLKAPNLNNCSVFFLKNTTDPYYAGNMGTGYEYIADPNGNNMIKVKVPNLAVGTYKAVLTNQLENPSTGKDIRYMVTSEVLVGEFTIINAANAVEIVSISPSQGPNLSNTTVVISGYNFDELNVDNLSIANLTSLSLADDQTLQIDYGQGTYTPGAIAKTVHVTRKIKVLIGANATFQPVPQQGFSKYYDQLKINTPLIPDKDIQTNPYQDVVVDIVTTLSVDNNSEKYEFEEMAVKEKGFLYQKSYVEPQVTAVTPDKIQVLDKGWDAANNAESYVTKEDITIGITGSNFMVIRYMINQKETAIYPIVNLGGNTFPTATMVVYNNNTVVDGTSGNETGNKIVLRIPAGQKIDPNTVNFPTYIEITNPLKNSSTYGYAIRKDSLIQFLTLAESSSPVITSITPNAVPLEGQKGVIITGYNFNKDVKVFVDEKQITCNRDQSSLKITFDATAWREGTARLLVMNSDGSSDSAPLIYVRTMTDPKITSVSPPQGTTNTLVVTSGSGFMSPDPTATDTDIGIYRLMGSRVLLGDQDLNEYYYQPNTNNIALQPYHADTDDKIIHFDTDSGQAVLAGYYYGIILKDENAGKFYILKYNAQGQIVLTNGVDNFEVTAAGSTLVAADNNGKQSSLVVTADTDGFDLITLTDENNQVTALKVMTPYKIAADNMIVNRVKVIDNGARILATIPDLGVQGLYDVSVVNPDTKKVTLPGAFQFFRHPQYIPAITSVIPNTGSVAGGYFIRINGANFEDNGTVKTRVFINAVEVSSGNVIVSADGKSIDAKVPAYQGDLKKELGTDHKSVPIVVLNPSDGGSAGNESAFTYVIPTSQPAIDKLSASSGSSGGGDYILLTGRDYRYFEPFDDTNNNGTYDSGETYVDLNSDGKWTEFSSQSTPVGMTTADIDVLPRVYFGQQLAEIKDFGKGFIGVITPPATAGSVDIFVLNNDCGISNKMKYTYKASQPQITSITPSLGRKQGYQKIEIIGKNFVASSVDLLQPSGNLISDQIICLVNFGEISNHNDVNSGVVVNGQVPAFAIEGGLTAEYSVTEQTLTLVLEYGSKIYQADFAKYDGSVKYIDLKNLQTSVGEIFPGYELIRVCLQNRRLIIERGYAGYLEKSGSQDILTGVDLQSSGQIIVSTPTYYTVGIVPVTVVNPDGATASGKFQYMSPASSPVITTITRDGNSPQGKNVNNEDVRILYINYKGGSAISVFGSGFMSNAQIQIADVLTIKPKDITYTLPEKLSFTIPAVDESEIGKLERVVVINEDGGIAASDQPSTESKELYIQFTKGESDPKISQVTSTMGPSSGGTVITITGKDLRQTMDGYEDKSLNVYIGGNKVVQENVKWIDLNTVTAVTPAAAPGKVEVRVENPDGEISSPTGTFTYISTPVITTVYSNSGDIISNVSVVGGQKLKLVGSGLMSGIKIIFTPVVAAAADSSTTGIIYKIANKTVNSQTSAEEKPYILESGTEASDVTFVDSSTVTFTTPIGKLNGQGIMVVNSDGGCSDIFGAITYTTPQTDIPQGVEAEIVHDYYYDNNSKYTYADKMIKIYWQSVDGVSQYKIYANVANNNEYIGSTKLTSYCFQQIKANTKYKFLVKAIGEYGESLFSEQSNAVSTGSVIGSSSTVSTSGQITQMLLEGKTAVITIGSDDFNQNEIAIDLTSGNLAGAEQINLNLPGDLVYAGSTPTIKITGNDFQLTFNPNAFKTPALAKHYNASDSGVKFNIFPYKGNLASGVNNSLSRAMQLQAYTCIGSNKTTIDTISSYISFLINYDTNKAAMRNYTQVDMFRWEQSDWKALSGDGIYGVKNYKLINRMGIYTIMGSRS